MKKTLLLALAMLLLVACGDSDSPTRPEVLNTTAHSEVDGTWPDGPSVSGINWRLVDLMGGVRVSYNMTWDQQRSIEGCHRRL